MGAWRVLRRDGIELAYRDFGGQGQPALLLHGLAGHAEEWTETASWLVASARVMALDARGHGRSERRPGDVSHLARVDDVVFVLDELGLEQVVLVGQSLGGITALSVAARYPEHVRGLVLIEASPSGGGDARDVAERVGMSLRRWPTPFSTREEVVAFFEERLSSRLAAEAWATGFAEARDGWRPRFDVDVMVETLQQVLSEPTWTDWEKVAVPVLVVRGAGGTLDAETADEMATRNQLAQIVEIAGAGHDVHLHQPAQWRDTLLAFLTRLA